MNPQPPANSPPTRSSSEIKPAVALTKPIRRHCKIARLPLETREFLNSLLRDGASYRAIIEALRQRGHLLNQSNLSRWHAGGFKDWLQQQAWLDEMRARLDFAAAIVKEPNAELLDQASLRIAVTRMYSLLTQFDPALLQLKLAESPGAYVRVLNALCNLTDTAMRLQRSRDQKSPQTSSPEPFAHV